MGLVSDVYASEIILCTDGLANVGIGSEDNSFYEKVSDTCDMLYMISVALTLLSHSAITIFSHPDGKLWKREEDKDIHHSHRRS